MRKCYFLLAILALLLQATQLHAVEWLVADGSDIGPDGKGFFSTSLEYEHLPAGTEYCRIYQTNGGDGISYEYDSGSNIKTAYVTRNFPDGTLRFRVAKAMGYASPTGYGNSIKGSWEKQYDLYITKAQAQALKSLDLSKPNAGSSPLSILIGIQIFENLETLNVSGNSLGWGIIPDNILYPKSGSGYDYSNPYHPWTGISKDKRWGSYTETNPFTNQAETRSYPYRYLGYMLRFFKHLKNLNASNCGLYELFAGAFVSKHKDNLEHIDLSNNINLYHVNVDSSLVKDLTLTGCTGLQTLMMSDTDIETIDLNGLENLTTLYAPNNKKLQDILHDNTEGYYDKLIYMDFKGDSSLTKIDHLEVCKNIRILKCQNCDLTELDIHDDAKLEMLLCSGNSRLQTLNVQENALKRLECANCDLSTLNAHSNPALNYLDCSGNKLTTLDVSSNTDLEQLYCYSNQLTSLNLSHNTKLKKLRISHNSIPTLDLTNNPLIEDFYLNNCHANTITGFEALSNLKVCKANNNDLTAIDFTNLTALETLLLTNNKLTEMDMTTCTNLKTLFCDAQGGYDNDGRWLKVLKLNSTNLTALKCDNNALLSLDLSNCPNLKITGTPNVLASCQRATQDIRVFDRNKVCIELPNGAAGYVADDPDDPTASEEAVEKFYTWNHSAEVTSGFDDAHSKVLYREGKYWLSIYNIGDVTTTTTTADAKADVDLYNKKISYCYYVGDAENDDENLGKSVYYGVTGNNFTLGGETVYQNALRGEESVIVNVYPYVMYINPISADVHSTSSTFYSGTIYLDYDAIVPAGTTAYIAKSILIDKDKIYSTAEGGQTKVTANQLELVPLIAGEGATEVVIPANTPVYIKSDSETGLFSFDRNNHGGVEQPLGVASDGSHLINDNILRGTLKDSVLRDSAGNPEKYRVLALGRGRFIGTGEEGYTSASRIGFWPSSRTSIPAHRVFIPMETLQNAGVKPNNSSGLLFSFDDELIETLSENNSFDFNKDGNVDVTDITAMINSIINGDVTAARSAKLNESEDNKDEGISNEISVTDVTSLINYIINMNKEVKQ